MKKVLIALAIVCGFGFYKFQTIDLSFGSDENWSEYLGGADRNHYSKLDQINLQNVKNSQSRLGICHTRFRPNASKSTYR